MKKAVVLTLTALAILLAVFAAGRFGWRLGGFRACEGAGIESVEVTDGIVRIRGFCPGLFPEGFIGCHSRQDGTTLYVGFRFSAVFGFFSTGDFDVSIPVEGEISSVVMKTGSGEHRIWGEAANAGTDGISVLLERDDVYIIGWYCENKSGGVSPAGGGSFQDGELLVLGRDIPNAAESMGGTVPFMLTLSGEGGQTLAQISLVYDTAQPEMTITAAADGRILVNGAELPQVDVPAAYETELELYRAALKEAWDGQRLTEAGMDVILTDLAAVTVGYCVDDLDGDGVPELAVGTMDGGGFYDRLILTLYTMDEEGNAQLVFASGARDRYYYAGGTRFANLGSSPADDSFETTVKLEGGALVDMTFTTAPENYVQMELLPLL